MDQNKACCLGEVVFLDALERSFSRVSFEEFLRIQLTVFVVFMEKCLV